MDVSLILKQNSALKSFAAVHEAFDSSCPDNEVPSK